MRSIVAHRVKGLERRKPVVISTEYHVAEADERKFQNVIDTIETAIKKAAGHTHFSCFKPLEQADGGAARYMTYEEWSDAAAFLVHWASEDLRRAQVKLTSYQARPSRIVLGLGGRAVAVTASGRMQVLRTGQERTWNSDGAEVDVPGADGMIRAGRTFAAPPRFGDNNDGTVTDSLTGLTWLKNANLYGEVPWEQALQLAGELASGAPGLSDGSQAGEWRLPNVNEMESLLNLDNSFGPAIDPESPFLNLEPSNYWTSSSVALAPPLGWFVALAVGPPVFDLKINLMRMWPVKGTTNRVAQTGQKQCFNVWGQPIPCGGTGQDGALRMGAPWPAIRFTDNKDGTITDELTGLVWLRDADAFGRLSWQDAIDACLDLESGDGELTDDSKAGDWRLPNLNELRSIVDYSEAAPALPKGHPFRGVQSSLYWSSTTVASAPKCARFVFIGVGPSVWDHKSVLLNVWPVRDRA